MRESVSPTLVMIALAAIVATMHLVRAYTLGTAQGSTTVDQSGNCSGGVQYTQEDLTDKRLGSNNGETVVVRYDVSWDDQRQSPATPRAYHNFTLTSVHLGNTVSSDKRVTTSGSAPGLPGSWSLWANATNVKNGEYVNVTYTASLSGPTGTGCPVLSSVTRYYHFVYP